MRFIVLLLVGCCCPCKESEEELKAREARIAKSKAEKDALEKRCGKKYGQRTWEDTCRDLVKERITYPKTAEFSYFMGASLSNDDENCMQYYSSTVTCKNAFGVEMEYKFVCSFNAKKNLVKLSYFGK
jgi:hypothetical protein